MNIAEIKEIIKKELPEIVREDLNIRQFILDLSRQNFPDKAQTQSRFDRIMDELRGDRETNQKKWDQNQKKWDQNQKKWDQNQKRWDQNQKKWDETLKIVKENQRNIERLFQRQDKHRAEAKKDLNDAFSALGARWGLRSEASFRNGLRAILEETFGVKVINVIERDDEGEVFGRPDQIELDIIIKNGVLIICEIKSSISKPDMNIFYFKAKFYQKRHGQTAQRLIAISPMIDDRAKKLARELNIEFYSHSDDVPDQS